MTLKGIVQYPALRWVGLVFLLSLLIAVLPPVLTRADDMINPVGVFAPFYFAELQDVELGENRAYLFGVGGFAIIDITIPSNPWFLGRYEPPGHPYNRFYRGVVGVTHAYGGGREDLMSVIDISDEAFPYRVQVHGQTGMSYEGMTIDGSYLYAARHADGIEIMDITNPAAPLTVAEYTGLINSWDLVVRDGIAYVADGVGGLAAIDVSTPAAPDYLYSLATSGAAADVTLAGDLALVACGSAGVDLFDISNPLNAQWLGNYNSSGLAINVDAVGDKMFIADWDDIEVVDISIPTSPFRIGWENTPVRAMGLAAAGDMVYVNDWSRFRIYEFGPTLTGDINLPFDEIDFGLVPTGTTVDTTFTVTNTGGGILQITDVASFNTSFVILPPTSFTIQPGESQEVGLRYVNSEEGYDATFIRIHSNDTDEEPVSFVVSGNIDPSYLDIGDQAPNFTLSDLNGDPYTLWQFGGKVVVLAFFANW